MASQGVSASSRTKVSTGYRRLDEALQGGFLAGSAIILSAPASDEVPLLLRNFLMPDIGEGLLLSRSLSAAQAVSQLDADRLKCLICSEKSVPPSKNMIPGKGIENLTELNFQITEAITSVQPKRVAIDILSDILLRHKALQTRKWLNEFLERLRSKGMTILAILNPYMHSTEDVQAVVDLFDGNLELIEKDVEGSLRKFLRIRWVHGVEVAEKEFPLLDLAQRRLEEPQQPTVVIPLKEPRWLTPLVGRTIEVSKLKTAFENALTNRSSVVALQGEAGVGKTRLMRELAVYARSKGGAVLTGNASEGGQPYAPWIEIARQYIGQAPGESLRRTLGPYLSEFARLVPDIAAKVGTIPPSKSLSEQQDKIRLYEAVTQFFISICSESPLLLLFDDVQSADQSSLELMEYFVRSASNLRVLTACSYRSEDVQTSSSLYQTLMKFNRQRLLETIQVKNLNKEETTELIKQTFGEQTVSPEFADLVYHRTAGNPFFVEEVLRSLVEDGIVFRTERKWDRQPIQEIVLPESVKSVLKSRLTRLQTETLNLLTMASVIGNEFDFEVLRDVTQTHEDALLERLEESITAGLISEAPNQRDVFRFADNRIRELLLGDLIRSRRIRYHVRIAEAMEKAYSKNLESQAETIATHFSEGGDTERTIKYSLMAGDRNKIIHAYDQAISDYKRAIDLIDLEGGNDLEKALVLEKLGQCYLAVEPPEGKKCFEQALAIFEKLNENKACARACVEISKAMEPDWLLREAVAVLKRGLEYVQQIPESFEAALIYSRLAWDYAALDEWDEANTWGEKAVEVGTKSGNFAAVCAGLMCKAAFLTDTGRMDEGLPLWERAYTTALQHENLEEAIRSLRNLVIYTLQRSLPKARELAVRLLDLSRQINDMATQSFALARLAELDWYAGEWTSALDEFRNSVEIRRRIGLQIFVDSPHPLYDLGVGDLDKAEKELRKLAEIVTQDDKITFIVVLNLRGGLLMLEQGRETEAQAYFEKAVNAFKKWEFTTMPLYHIETLLHLTELFAKHGELERASNTSKWARRLAETLKSDAGLAMAAQAEASLLLSKEDRKACEEAYLRSLESWEKAGWAYYKAKALAAYSEAIAQSNPEESKKRLEQAAEVFEKLGAKRDLERAQAKLTS